MSSLLQLIFGDLVVSLGVSLLVAAGCLLVSDEFKKFSAARALFYLAAAWTCGRALMWSVFTSDSFYTRAVATFLVFGLVGVGLTEALRATNHRENSLKSVATQEPPKPIPPTQQKSEGQNSPNTNVTGNNNRVTVNVRPPHTPPPLSQPTFREEKTDISLFFLGGNGCQ